MPAEAPDPALRWQALADEARTIADQMTDPQQKLILLTIARGYDRLAERASARSARTEPDAEE
jgi:hypothetical protein